MGMVHGPNLVTDGLQFYIDPSNVQCYPGSGSTIYDLSGNGRDATMYLYQSSGNKTTSGHGITVSGGWFNFPTSNHFSFISLPSSTIAGLTAFTMEFWIYPSSITSNINTLVSSGAANNFLWYINSTTNITYSNQGCGSGGVSFDFTAANNLFTLVRSSSTIQTYRNTVAKGSIADSIALTVPGTFGEFVVGQEYDSNANGDFEIVQSWLGKIGPIRIYNRALSTAELTQNYNAHKSRYGL